MIQKKQLNLFKAIPFVKWELLWGAFVSTTVYLIYDVGGVSRFALPNLLPTVLGTAVSIFVGFRNNAAYGRWTEASLIWASIINNCNIFGRLMVTFVESHNHTATFDATKAKLFKQEMVYRLIAWAHMLRVELLYGNPPKSDVVWKDVRAVLSEQDFEIVSRKDNKATALLVLQGHRIYDAMRDGTLMGFDSFQLENSLAQLSNFQAQCERLKTIPIPRQYTFFTRMVVWIFIAIIPFSYVPLFDTTCRTWVVIPITLLFAFIFGIVERTGCVNEEPFRQHIVAVPLLYLSTQVERNLREIMGEESLPPAIVPVNGYLW